MQKSVCFCVHMCVRVCVCHVRLHCRALCCQRHASDGCGGRHQERGEEGRWLGSGDQVSPESSEGHQMSSWTERITKATPTKATSRRASMLIVSLATVLPFITLSTLGVFQTPLPPPPFLLACLRHPAGGWVLTRQRACPIFYLSCLRVSVLSLVLPLCFCPPLS